MMLELSDGTVIADVVRITVEDGMPSLSIALKKKAKAAVLLRLSPAKPLVFSLDVTLGEASSLSLLCISPRSDHPQKITQNFSLASASALLLFNVTLSDRCDQAVVSRAEGADAKSKIDWLFCASGRAELVLNARNVFAAKGGEGDITMKGIAEDRATVDCRGMIEIGKSGGGTKSYLTQNILMLDASAKVDAVPALEIKTNDVKASHSAAVTKVSEEDLFYLASRGIPREEARAMYIQGFLGDVLMSIENDEMREEAEEALEEKMR